MRAASIVTVAAMLLFSGTMATPASAQQPKAIDCTNAVNQMEMGYCAEKDFQAADSKLNEYWKPARQAAIARDQELQGDDKGAEKALLAAQRAWIAYRDATCVAEGFAMRDGSAEDMTVSMCKTRLTQQRTKDLKAYADSLKQK